MVVSASSSTLKVCVDGKSEDFVEKIALTGGGGGADVVFVPVLLQSPPVCLLRACGFIN